MASGDSSRPSRGSMRRVHRRLSGMGAAGAATCDEGTSAESRSASAASSSAGKGVPSVLAAISRAMWSLDASTTDTSSGETCSAPVRTRSSTVSTWWVNVDTDVNPIMALEPLTVWKMRKRWFTPSRSA
jgi:hypothetical protein